MADTLAPGLLIAVPQLLDPNFHKSVVLLVEHSEEGALGFVINRASTLKVGALFEKLELGPCAAPEGVVLVGGPVQPERGMLIHGEGREGGSSHAVTDAVFISSSASELKRLFDKPNPRALFVLGYAGWGPGQLEHELEEGSWIPAPVDDVLIFDTEPSVIWDSALRQLGIDPLLLVRGDSDSDVN